MSGYQGKPLHTDAQAFPLVHGKLNLTSGTALKGAIIFCVEDGDIAVTFPESATPVTISMLSGWVFTLPVGASVNLTGTAGTFHLSR